MGNQCRSALVFFTGFTFFFAISVVFAYLTWADYQASIKQDWPKYECTVVDNKLQDCATLQDENQRIIEVYVEPFKVNDEYPDTYNETTRLVTAFRTSAVGDCLKIEDAEEFLEDYPEGRQVDCFSDGHGVRLTRGGDSRFQIATYRVRAIFPIIASIISGITLIYASYQLFLGCQDARIRRGGGNDVNSLRYSQDSLGGGMQARMYGSRAASDEMFVSRPPRAEYSSSTRRPVSNRDAKLLISALRGPQNKPSDKDQGEGPNPCPICLEDLKTQAESTHIYLPCSHGYHHECILQWFRKGSGSCPYCNHDLMDLLRSLRIEEAESRLMDKSRRQLNLQSRPETDGSGGSNGNQDTTQEGERSLEEQSAPEAGRQQQTGVATGGSSTSGQPPSFWSWEWWSRQLPTLP